MFIDLNILDITLIGYYILISTTSFESLGILVVLNKKEEYEPQYSSLFVILLILFLDDLDYNDSNDCDLNTVNIYDNFNLLSIHNNSDLTTIGKILESIEYLLMAILFIVGLLLGVAYLTVAERKTMAYMQRRLGPNAVGYYGVLMAIADALKLLVKEIVLVHNGEYIYMIGGPLITLYSVLISFGVVPLNTGLGIIEGEYSLIFLLGAGSLGVLVRTTAQLISYELILTTIVFIIVLLVNSLNIELIIENQVYINYIIPLLPLCIIYFIAALAETARPPFDNIEAESELVSGHMTELSASPFVIFFLSEYTSMVLMSALT
ncbi:NADH:ubiquinone dehydrogenase subunit 1, partial [Pichia californica]